MASFSALIAVVLGLIPLVQWIVTRRASGLTSLLFGATTAPAAWAVPGAILLAGVLGTLGFGIRGDKAAD